MSDVLYLSAGAAVIRASMLNSKSETCIRTDVFALILQVVDAVRLLAVVEEDAAVVLLVAAEEAVPGVVPRAARTSSLSPTGIRVSSLLRARSTCSSPRTWFPARVFTARSVSQ